MNPAVPQSLYDSIKEVLKQARNNAYRAVNFSMVQAYWETGRLIVEDEQAGKRRASFGKAVIKELSQKLTRDFGPGFGEQALRSYRQFFLTFPIRASLRRELTWTHYRMIIKVINVDAWNYYIKEAATQQWKVRTLERHINSFYYERLLSSQDKRSIQQEMAAPPMQPQEILKDPLVPEFLNLPANLSYKERISSRPLSAYPAFYAGAGQGLCIYRPAAAYPNERCRFLYRPGLLQLPAEMLCPGRPENG